MHWNSASEFFAMGGYALYVWGSFGACAVAMLAEPWLIGQQRRALLQSLRDHREALEAEQAAASVEARP